MPDRIFVTGTDTGIGKTVVSALLMIQNPGFVYWKPIQSGLEEPTDTQSVKQLASLSENRIIPEAYQLVEPRSPHESAAMEGITIEMNQLKIPSLAENKPLIIEGAGGLMVPINDRCMMIDLISFYKASVILVARSGLGTLNHTFLSLEALRKRNIPIKGIVLNGEKHPSNKKTIAEVSQIPILAEIEPVFPLTFNSLKKTHFPGLVL